MRASRPEKEVLETILKCSKRLRNAYLLKEEFRQIYETHQAPEVAKERGSPGMRRVVREPISQNLYWIGFSALPSKSKLYNKLQFLA
jgi:hypothetical protein